LLPCRVAALILILIFVLSRFFMPWKRTITLW
jgi:hypothetical protein